MSQIEILFDEEFIEDENQKENNEDINELNNNDFSQAVLSGNDWTTETIINQINKGNIQLNPNFQRRDAWDKDRKSKFIESLIIGLPVPQLVFAESKEKKGSYIVLDGKQRLLSIRQFAAKDGDAKYEQLKLVNLDIRKDLSHYNLEILKNNPENEDDLSIFENQPIRTVVIKNWPNEDFLYHIFLRLNTGSVPLSPQELRQALHPGSFVSYVDETSSKSKALQEILKIKKADFRMRDAELLLRYLSFKNRILDYKGSLKDFLDDTCKYYNKKWVAEEDKIKNQVEEFEKSHIIIKSIFKEGSYRKWTENGYENRFNRSIFDIMMLSFSQENVRNRVHGKEPLIKSAFENLCISDFDFRLSIESTTKSISATNTRVFKWIDTLSEIIGINIAVEAPKTIV